MANWNADKKEDLLKAFKFCKAHHNKMLPEIKELRRLYDNRDAVDWFSVCENEFDKKRLFKSGLVSQMTNLRASLMSSGRPRFYLNPVFREDVNLEDDFVAMAQAGYLPENVVKEIAEFGNPKEWLDHVVDNIADEWYTISEFKTVARVGIKSSLLTSKSWFKLSEQDGQIKVKYIPFENVYDDPDADTRDDRRWIFHVTVKDCQDIEKEYDLEKDSLVAEKDYDLGAEENDTKIRAVENSGIQENEYSDRKCRLIEAYIKDDSVEEIDGEEYPLYPFGKIVTFVLGQNDDVDSDSPEGMMILDEVANTYSEFPLMDYVPELNDSETEGRPLGRDLANLQHITDRAVQQSLLNYEIVGNAVMFIDDGALDPHLESKLKNKPGIIIPISGNVEDVKYQAPISTSQEGLAISSAMSQFAQNISGLHEAAQGKKTGRVESSKAYIVLSQQAQQILQPSVREWERFLTRFVKVWSEMILNTVHAGFVVRSGRGFKNRMVLPFSLSAYIDNFEPFIDEDSTLPKDSQSQANLIMEILRGYSGGNYALLKTILRTAGIDDVDTIIKELQGEAQTEQQLKQLAEQLQATTGQNEQLQKMIQQLSKQNNDLTLSVKANELKSKYDIQKQLIKEEGFEERQKRQLENKRELEANRLELEALSELHDKGGSRSPETESVS